MIDTKSWWKVDRKIDTRFINILSITQVYTCCWIRTFSSKGKTNLRTNTSKNTVTLDCGAPAAGCPCEAAGIGCLDLPGAFQVTTLTYIDYMEKQKTARRHSQEKRKPRLRSGRNCNLNALNRKLPMPKCELPAVLTCVDLPSLPGQVESRSAASFSAALARSWSFAGPVHHSGADHFRARPVKHWDSEPFYFRMIFHQTQNTRGKPLKPRELLNLDSSRPTLNQPTAGEDNISTLATRKTSPTPVYWFANRDA